MKSPQCLIYQPAGIGDILYTYQIGHYYAAKGYDVIWPVIDQYYWLPEYISSPAITFVSSSDEFPFRALSHKGYSEIVVSAKGDIYIPLSRSTLNGQGRAFPLMLSKYAMLGLERASRRWHHFISINRNKDREARVIAYYEIDIVSEYIFCNTMIGSPDGHLQELTEMKRTIESISNHSNYRVLENTFIPRTTIFDFLPILMNAKEVHLPNSALAWLTEWLAAKGLSRHDQKRYCYPRDLVNPINFNYKYMKGCWNESNWFFIPPNYSSLRST